ncbi:MAG: hypothetical protein AAB377_03425 [Patescibacteria group bacterium]
MGQQFYYYFEPGDTNTDRCLADFLTEDSRREKAEVLEKSHIRKTMLFETADLESIRKINASRRQNLMKFKIFRGNIDKQVIPIPFKLMDPKVRKKMKTAHTARKLRQIRNIGAHMMYGPGNIAH